MNFTRLVSISVLLFLFLSSSFLFASLGMLGGMSRLSSPDGSQEVIIEVLPSNQVIYSIVYRNNEVIKKGCLGLKLDDGTVLPDQLKCDVVISANQEHRGTWKPVYGERSEIPDNYNERTITWNGSDFTFSIIFRAYNEGIAFRYQITSGSGNVVVQDDLTEFAFVGDFPCWTTYAAQGAHVRVPLSQVKPDCERPLLVEMPSVAVSIGEAGLVDFSRMRLKPLPEPIRSQKPHSLTAHLAASARIEKAGFSSPWRFVMAADRPGQLVERNYLLQNLNEPNALQDTSWIKPGKVIRETTLTTDGGKACIDFAVAQNLQYIEFDAGWYGFEYDDNQDATTITIDPKRSKGPLDLEEVIRYGKEKGIGVWVYVNNRHLKKQLDQILPLYKKWGIVGIKYGFVDVGNQDATKRLHDAISKTAEYQLMVDVHDEYRMTGWERTYPNFLTSEGIRGNEEMPSPEQNCMTALLRTLCGAGDYTHCWYAMNRLKTTHAHQLASVVVMYSPLQFLYWYDRPIAFKNEPELDFWRTIPTVWDDTKVIHDKVGEYATFARRTGKDWYIGTLNAVQRRELVITLDFLEPNKTYLATIYTDAAPNGENPFQVSIQEKKVQKGDVINVDMAANGGAAIRLIAQ
ncbi:MAG: glycoside hydrolase family 97 catalytic domain-containing protein [Thermoguttaceae bacterium]